MANKVENESSRLERVIEAGLDELIELCEASFAAKDRPEPSVFYAQVIVHFLRGEQSQLAECVKSVRALYDDHEEVEYLELACRLREQIRLRVCDPQLIRFALSLVSENAAKNSAQAARWRGEVSILIATIYTVLDQYDRAQELYTQAVTAFEKQGCDRKSLRARMNVLVCESHVHPERNLFARYHDLYRRSLRRGKRELIVATTCLLNISREYQRAGAYMVALKYCNRALSLFELQMGELNYFLTLAHRAHLLCELDRRAEARLDFEAAKLGNFKEVEAALEMIEPLLLGEKPRLTGNSALLPTWRERSLEANTPARPKLSALEEKLIALLSSGARDRIDILEEIYGENLDHDTKLNRFKSLLSTLRKKYPDLIICEQGQYRLADEILVPTRTKLAQTGA